MTNKKYELEDILNKEQFNMKLGAKYFLLSMWNIAPAVAIYLVSSSFIFGMAGYFLACFFLYRYAFSYKRSGDHLEPFLIKYGQKFYRYIRYKSRA